MATVRKLESGKWQAIVRRKGVAPVFKTFTTKADCDKWARQVETAIECGTYVPRLGIDDSTLGALIDRYIAEVSPLKRSCRNDVQRLRYLRRHFGAMSTATLRSYHIAQWRDMRIAEGKSGSTVVKEINSLSHVLDTAIRDWNLSLTFNPAKLVRKPKQARGRDRRLDANEEQRLLAACKASRSHFMLVPLVQLALETAMRLGELLALEWQCIDLQKRVARLHLTKNGETRDIPLSTAAMASLGNVPKNITSPRVFWMWRRVDSVEHVWQRAVKRASIADLRFHDLRHEAVSRLFERGLNPMEVAAISGHKTLQMLKRYTHLKAENLVAKLA